MIRLLLLVKTLKLSQVQEFLQNIFTIFGSEQ